ncbi:MAG: acetylxylan esterase [Blastopirellula sp.]|nr:MAG: acetylxylan esterase [Blastopirellula sp.]
MIRIPLRSHVLGLFLLALLTSAGLYTSTAQAADTYQLTVVTDREDALYEVGQEAKFLISVTKNGQPAQGLEVSYVVDDFLSGGAYPSGTLTLDGKPAVVVAKASKPVFLRCTVTINGEKKITTIAGAGFAPLKIKPSLPAPKDFDKFWADQKEQLAAVPAKAQLTAVPQNDDTIVCFDVQVDCTGGAPVSGYFGKPKAAKPKSLPAVLWVHGAGVRGSSLSNAVKGAKSGMLSMDINAHGIANGKPGAFYQELSAGRLKGYPHSGNDSRDTTYFRGMFLRLVRAIDFLTAQPEWDGKTIAVIGHSQGGGQALVAGGIDDRVTFIASGVPAICDHSGRAAGRINGWPKLVPTGKDGTPAAAELQAGRYVDAVNFASRCKADAIMSVGFIDRTCPPSSCYAAYNLLQGNKQVINKPLMGHAAPADIQTAFFDAILKHVEDQK